MNFFILGCGNLKISYLTSVFYFGDDININLPLLVLTFGDLAIDNLLFEFLLLLLLFDVASNDSLSI
jgi:hypothetical protein|tara:strand:+ start:91 stop:291 length:201 start_codon:yes stop_codon:yes gene_type:complete